MQSTMVYEIGYKAYYRELKDWSCDYIKARDRKTALRRFSRVHRIPKALRTSPRHWQWWEGDWYMAFAYIRAVTARRCWNCSGTGEVSVL